MGVVYFSLALVTTFYSYVAEYVGVSDMTLSIDSLDEYIDRRQSYNMDGGSSIDISSMNMVMKVFSYLFRPLPFEAHSVLALFSSLENLALMMFILYSFKYFITSKDKLRGQYVLFIYSVVCLLVLSLTTANLGIAVRQKWMFMPCIIVILLNTFPERRNIRKNEVVNNL